MAFCNVLLNDFFWHMSPPHPLSILRKQYWIFFKCSSFPLCKGYQIFFVVLYIFMEIILDHFHSSLSLLSFSFLFFILLYPMRLFLCVGIANFTLQQLQTNGCVLKHQAISIHSADWMFIVLDQFHTEALYLWGITLEIKITFWIKVT